MFVYEHQHWCDYGTPPQTFEGNPHVDERLCLPLFISGCRPEIFWNVCVWCWCVDLCLFWLADYPIATFLLVNLENWKWHVFRCLSAFGEFSIDENCGCDMSMKHINWLLGGAYTKRRAVELNKRSLTCREPWKSWKLRFAGLVKSAYTLLARNLETYRNFWK